MSAPADAAAVTLRRARLAAQHLTGATRLPPDAASIARAVCGVQAQSMKDARLAMRARSRGLTASVAEHAVATERSVVRTWLMRGTLHLVPAEDVRWMLDVLGPTIDARDATRRRQVGLTDALCKRGVARIRAELEGGPMTGSRLRERLRSRGLAIGDGQAMIHLLAHAAHLGVICKGSPEGRTDTYVLLDDWVPRAAGPSGEAALAEFARRYMAGYAPASLRDLMVWSGLRAGPARAALAGIAHELTETPGVSGPLFSLKTQRRPRAAAAGASVRLLPSWDTYTLGYASRDFMIAPQFVSRFQAGGLFYQTVCVDGWLAGAWRWRLTPAEVVVEVDMFDPPRADITAGLDAEVRSIGWFFDLPARRFAV